MFKVLLSSCSILALLIIGSCQELYDTTETTEEANTQWTPFETTSTAGLLQTSTLIPLEDCSGIIFVQEMSQYIPYDDKFIFFNLIKRIASAVSPYLQFGFFQYGNGIYQRLQLTDYYTFVKTVDNAEADFNITRKPNGSLVYIAP